MAEKLPLGPEEVRRVLRELAPLSEYRRIILVGGQAVALWAVFFELTTPTAERRSSRARTGLCAAGVEG